MEGRWLVIQQPANGHGVVVSVMSTQWDGYHHRIGLFQLRCWMCIA